MSRQELLTEMPVNLPRGRGPEEGGVIAIRTMLRKLGACARGATAIEYGLICALIIIAMIGRSSGVGRWHQRHVGQDQSRSSTTRAEPSRRPQRRPA